MNKIEKTILIILPLLGIVYLLPMALLGLLGFFEGDPYAIFIQAIIIICILAFFLIVLLMGKLKTRLKAWGFFAIVILLTIIFNAIYNIIVWDAALY